MRHLFLCVWISLGWVMNALHVDARIIPIPAGTNRIREAARLAVREDTLMLVTNRGVYHETDWVRLPALPLTIMADPTLPDPPTWTTDGTRHIRVYHDLVVKGIRFDGRGQTAHALRSYADRPNKIVVDGCEIANMSDDGITATKPVDTCIVRNALFFDLPRSAIEFRNADMCHNLIVENSTFYRLGEYAIHMKQDRLPLSLQVKNITVHDCLSGIQLIGVKEVAISNSIFTYCSIWAVQSPDSISVRNSITFKNRKNHRRRTSFENCLNVDPQYFNADAGNFSLLPNSLGLRAAEGAKPVGDLRWTGAATIRAGRLQFLNTWGRGVGMLFILGAGLFLPIRYVRKREKQKIFDALEKAQEMEQRVLARTAELKLSNEKLQREIVQRKQTEEVLQERELSLLQAKKLEAIGLLAGGIAHDFNNQLAIIRGYLDLTLEQISQDAPIFRYLMQIDAAIQRSSSLTSQLLIFSSGKPVDKCFVDLNHRVIDLVNMLERLLGEDITIHLNLEENLWPVNADVGNMDQVIVNLSINARDAMPEGGTLDIQSRNVWIDVDYCREVPEAEEGRYICLKISDTGIGMNKETLQRIFDPFFTTKGLGKGTGLGLAVIYGIVHAHGGWIKVDSQVDKGSSFEIYLPANEEKAAEVLLPQQQIGSNRPVGEGERVLLVEDEPHLREVTHQVLAKKGYIIQACATVTEATEIFQRAKTPFDLILSDVVLPDGRGTDLVLQCLEQQPDMRAILFTGYTDKRSDYDRIQEAGLVLLQKPVLMTVLLEQIHKTLKKS